MLENIKSRTQQPATKDTPTETTGSPRKDLQNWLQGKDITPSSQTSNSQTNQK